MFELVATFFFFFLSLSVEVWKAHVDGAFPLEKAAQVESRGSSFSGMSPPVKWMHWQGIKAISVNTEISVAWKKYA